MSDNYHFDLVCTPLEESLSIAFHGAPGKKATHWKIVPEAKKLLLAWNENAGTDFVPFVSPIDAEAAVKVVKGFLAEQNYGTQPDHDGDNGKSWRIYNEAWGHVGGNPYVFVAIEPVWAEYGK